MEYIFPNRQIKAHNEFSILTPSNAEIDFEAPDPEEILPSDMLRGMVKAQRFANQAKWSVLQHSLLALYCCFEVPPLLKTKANNHVLWKTVNAFSTLASPLGIGTPSTALARCVLYHDSHEGYTGDLPKPLKRKLGPAIVEVEKKLDAAIGVALQLPDLSYDEVVLLKAIDAAVLDIERAWLQHPPAGILPEYNDLLKDWPGLDFIKYLDTLGKKQQRILFTVVDRTLRRKDDPIAATRRILSLRDYDKVLDVLLNDCLLNGTI